MDSTVLILMLTSILTPIAEQSQRRSGALWDHHGADPYRWVIDPAGRSGPLYCLHDLQMLALGFCQGRLAYYVVCCRWWYYRSFSAGFGFMASESDIWNR